MRFPLRSHTRVVTVIAIAAVATLGAVATADAQRPLSPEAVRDTIYRTSIAADYEYTTFGGDIQAWQLGSVSLGQRTPAGSLIGRVNVANRFGTSGSQYEADAYPHLGVNGTYAYLNFGYSAASIFPRWRSGAEIYTNLPSAYEASLGYRQLRFAGSPPVTLFTGTVGKYTGNYWFSLRPYVRQKTNGTSASVSLTGRKYGADADDYVGARVGYGTTPSDRLTVDELARTRDVSADVHGSRGLANDFVGIWSIGFENEQLPAGASRKRWDVSGGVRYVF